MHSKEKTCARVVFFGTSEFAIPSLEALLEHGYTVLAAVTTPDKPSGRKNILTPPSVKVAAKLRGISVFQPQLLTTPEFFNAIRELAPDLFVTAAYGTVIPKKILDVPARGALNVHPSLLPRWRGPSPIQYAMLQGDTETGVTIMQMDALMDHGPIVVQRPLEISKTTYPELHDALAKLGAELLIETLPLYFDGAITLTAQDHVKATYSKKITKADGRIDWSRPAEHIERMVRAFTPWPGTWTTWPSANGVLRLKIEAAAVTDDHSQARSVPGTVWRSALYPLAVTTGKRGLAVSSLILEGKKATDAFSFVHGHSEIIGVVLI